MIFSKEKELEDRIIEIVLAKKASIKSLHAELSAEKKLSLRAVYKSVDKLLAAGVLVKAGKWVVVDAEWAQRAAQHLKPIPLSIPAPGERISHSFVSIENLDAFWKTIVLPIEEAASEKEVFFYNPHNFWAYIPERKESEEAYYRHFAAKKRHGFLVVGGETTADLDFKRAYQNDYFQVDTRDIGSLRRNEHLTILGSLIITVRLPKKIGSRLDELYASEKSIKSSLPNLLAALATPGTARFILENNPLKAKKLRKLLARNFYLPKEN